MSDIDSNLPVKDSADGTDGVSAPTIVTQVGGIDGSNNLQSLSVDTSGKLNINKASKGGGVQSALTVSTSAVELKVGGSALTNRINATLYNNSLVLIYWGYTNAVTTSTGTPIQPGQAMSWDVGSSTSVYLIAAAGSNNTRITEAAG